MNKQELINRLIKLLEAPSEIEGSDFDHGHNYGIERAILLAEQLNEQQAQINKQEKPVVPQFVADWYVDHKAGFELHLSYLCINAQRYPERVDRKVLNWYNNLENEPIRTLVNMHQFGYEVEKEKLYTAKLKLTNEYLSYRPRFNALLHCIVPETTAKEIKLYHFTEDDLVKYHVWGNDTYEVTEVEE